MIDVEVQNVVAVASLDQKFDLLTIVKVFKNVEYRPKRFPGLVFRLKRPKTATLIFTSGKMVCTGAKSEKMARSAVMKVVRELKKVRDGRHVCTCDSFKRNYVYILKKLGLIEEARREPVPGQPNWHERRYYRIVPGRETLTDEWTNPQKAWKLKRYGYYKRKDKILHT